ncbi:hypothetical protein [Bradyrhizobium sp. CCGE-LA001]|uniref:hypothetical protein n=2 Tax=unclassified Bradyrhizobium TaxID=2631580 RepID=UPI000745D177|nr:hypothetical protein [Bradyrhizobium sp. CCGE-LA001]AMA57032.1 hypothetical protein BCCGELA001_12780 [Bradyrhizobium sp. CCGE-LA001]
MPPPTAAQLKLIRDYEPILFFYDGPADQPKERFFPSDAKRYLERCELWKASDPFDTRSTWGGNAAIEAGKISAIEGEGGEGSVFLGKKTGSTYDFLETPKDKECFLALEGWRPAGSSDPPPDSFANLDKIAEVYNGSLENSRFWYHAEFFDSGRLEQLWTLLKQSGGNDFASLTAGSPGRAPELKIPALICYYLFYPGHDEGLGGCENVPEADKFGSFAGEWHCFAVLLDKPTAAGAFEPKWAGITRRNVGVIRQQDKEVRVGMRVFPWPQLTVDMSHARLVIAGGSHAMYLFGETAEPVVPLTDADPSRNSCGRAEAPQAPLSESTQPDWFAVLAAKILAGAAAAAQFGGAPVGAVIGLFVGLAELAVGAAPDFDEFDTSFPPGRGAPGPLTDALSTNGTVVHPAGLRPPGVAQERSKEWRSKDNLQFESRRYDSSVDRDSQILWSDDVSSNVHGYTGRWGPRVERDPQLRRAGMKFPNFWRMFFDELVRAPKNSPPPPPPVLGERKVVPLQTGTTAWTVPLDWNNNSNSIECIGGGGSGRGALEQSCGGGGGGAYSRAENLTYTPGKVITVQVGGVAGDTFVKDDADAVNVCFAKGGVTATTGSGGAGGAAASGIGSLTTSGGAGADGQGSSSVGGGGGGAAGPSADGTPGVESTGGAGEGGLGGFGGPSGVSGAPGSNLSGRLGPGGGGGGTFGAGSVAGGGGRFGGGGGGQNGAGVDGTPGVGGDGLIIISYTPA